MTVKRSRGIDRVRSLRLCSRAWWMEMEEAEGRGPRAEGGWGPGRRRRRLGDRRGRSGALAAMRRRSLGAAREVPSRRGGAPTSLSPWPSALGPRPFFQIGPKGPPGVAVGMAGHLGGGAGADQLAARLAALWSQVDHPVGGGDEVQVVLDHHQRMTRGDQPPQGLDQHRDVGEVESSGGLVHQEQEPLGSRLPAADLRQPLALGPRPSALPRQMPRELQPLGLAAGEGRHRLAEAQITQTHGG